MRRGNKTKGHRMERQEGGFVAYFRRLALPALGWAILGLGAVLITRPSRLGLLFSGTVEWWRLTSFGALVLFLSFSVAAFNEWSRKRKRDRR
jgi:hypothetical protein